MCQCLDIHIYSVDLNYITSFFVQFNSSQPTLVYNGSTSLQRKFTTGFIVQMGEELAASTPFDKMLWKPGGCITKCRYNNYIKFIVFHLLVAYVVDLAFRLTSNKPL